MRKWDAKRLMGPLSEQAAREMRRGSGREAPARSAPLRHNLCFPSCIDTPGETLVYFKWSLLLLGLQQCGCEFSLAVYPFRLKSGRQEA